MRAWAKNGQQKWGPFGFIKWVRHWQIQPFPYRLPAWAQGSTHIDNLYMGYEREKYMGPTFITYMGQTWANTISPI